MHQFQSSCIDDMVVGKARKKEGYYICPIGCEERKVPFVISLNKAKIVTVKETSNTLVLKCKDAAATRFMDELNERIIDEVRTNSSTWFNSSIDNDLIDEYYISTLQYDRKQGETIRIKCTNLEDIEAGTAKLANLQIVLTLKHLKFFKQKFFAEFQVEGIESVASGSGFVDDDDEDCFVEDECPLPSYDEVMAIKQETLAKMGAVRAQIATELDQLSIKNEQVKSFVKNLEMVKDLYDIIKMCEEGQIILCD